MFEKFSSKAVVTAAIVLTFGLLQAGLGGAIAYLAPQMPISMMMLIVSSVSLVVAFPLSIVKWGDFRLPGEELGMNVRMLLALILLCLGMGILNEFVELPNNAQEIIKQMISTPVGIFVVAILAPLVEECFFRAGMMGHILRRGGKPWVAIAVSAVAFGLVHANPAQIPFAVCIGIALGYVYYRTRNIITTTLAHVANNSMTVGLYLMLGNERAEAFRLTDHLGGMYCAGIVAVMLIASSIALFKTSSDTTHLS